MRRRELLSLLCAAPLAACARRSGSSDSPLELLADAEAATIDPRFVADVVGLRVSRLVHGTLAAPHVDTLRPEPWIAESLDDDDGGAVIATIRRDARFHDGTKITARDVLSSFAAMGDASLSMPAQRIVRELDRVEALDGDGGRRVRFVPRQPRAVLKQDLDLPILKADEARRPRDAFITGSGPYAIGKLDRGAIALIPADAYGAWASRARRAVVVRTVRDESARALRILAGGADVASNVLAPPLAMALPSKSDAPAGLTFVRRPSPSTTFLTMNLEHPPLDRLEVRRAIAMAIDRRALVDAKLGGAALVADGFLPAITPFSPRERVPSIYDPAAAREVLAPLGARGVVLSLVVTAQRTRVGVGRAIAQMLGDAGLPIDLRVYELGTMLSRLKGGSFDLASQTAVELGDPEMMRWYFHSAWVPPSGANRGRIRDAELDALLDRGLRTLDGDGRRAIYTDAERRIRELALIAPLYHEDHVAVVSERASSFRPSADGRWGAIADA